jgi:hypothetical protein
MLNPTLFVFINEPAVGILLKREKTQFINQSLNSLLPRPKPRRPEIKGSYLVAEIHGLRENSAAYPLARLDELVWPFQPLKLPSYGET